MMGFFASLFALLGRAAQSPSMGLRFGVALRAALITFLFVGDALAEEPRVIQVVIQNHVFTPSEIRIPAGKAVTLHVRNMDNQAEEFESGKLKIEKVIAAKSEANVRLRPLDKGKYEFIGEYHNDTAHGVIIAE